MWTWAEYGVGAEADHGATKPSSNRMRLETNCSGPERTRDVRWYDLGRNPANADRIPAEKFEALMVRNPRCRFSTPTTAGCLMRISLRRARSGMQAKRNCRGRMLRSTWGWIRVGRIRRGGGGARGRRDGLSPRAAGRGIQSRWWRNATASTRVCCSCGGAGFQQYADAPVLAPVRGRHGPVNIPAASGPHAYHRQAGGRAQRQTTPHDTNGVVWIRSQVHA